MSRRRLTWRKRLLQAGQTFTNDARAARRLALPSNLPEAVDRLSRHDKYAPSQRRHNLVVSWFRK